MPPGEILVFVSWHSFLPSVDPRLMLLQNNEKSWKVSMVKARKAVIDAIGKRQGLAQSAMFQADAGQVVHTVW